MMRQRLGWDLACAQETWTEQAQVPLETAQTAMLAPVALL